MTTLGISDKKRAKKDTKGHKSDDSQDDAEAFLKQLEKKKEESPDTCVFC